MIDVVVVTDGDSKLNLGIELLTTGDADNRRLEDFCKLIDKQLDAARFSGVLEPFTIFGIVEVVGD